MGKFTKTNLNTYSRKKKASQHKSNSSKYTFNHIVNNFNFKSVTYNIFHLSQPSSGDEFDQLLKGPVFQTQTQFSYTNSSCSKKNFSQRQDSVTFYNSDAAPSSPSSVRLFKDIFSDSNSIYSPSCLPSFSPKGKNKKKVIKHGAIKRKRTYKRKVKIKHEMPKINLQAASSTPNFSVPTSNKLIVSLLSPILSDPPLISVSTPKSNIYTSSPKDMFAIEKSCDEENKENAQSCDMSALVKNLGKLELFTPKTASKNKAKEKPVLLENCLKSSSPEINIKSYNLRSAKKVNRNSRRETFRVPEDFSNVREQEICDKLLACDLSDSVNQNNFNLGLSSLKLKKEVVNKPNSEQLVKANVSFDSSCKLQDKEIVFENKASNNVEEIETKESGSHIELCLLEIPVESKDNCDRMKVASESPRCTNNTKNPCDIDKLLEQSDCEKVSEISQFPEQNKTCNDKMLNQTMPNLESCSPEIEKNFLSNLKHRISLLPGKKWRRSFIKQKLSETKRPTVGPSILAKLVSEANLNFTSNSFFNVTAKSTSCISEPNDSFFRRVTTRPRFNKKSSFFNHSIKEEDSFQISEETSAYIPQPDKAESRLESIVANSTALTTVEMREESKRNLSKSFGKRTVHCKNFSSLSPKTNVAKLRVKSNVLLPNMEQILEESTEVSAEPGETSLNKKVEEDTSEDHFISLTENICTPKSSNQKLMENQLIQNSPRTPITEFASTFETPPILKLNPQALLTITKRSKKNKTQEEMVQLDLSQENILNPSRLSFMDDSNLDCCKIQNDDFEVPSKLNNSSRRYILSRIPTDSFEDDTLNITIKCNCLDEESFSSCLMTSVEDKNGSFEEMLHFGLHKEPIEQSIAGQDLRFPVEMGRYCSQLLFSEAFPDEDLEKCIKVGEGVYGEVFMLDRPDGKTVVKIIPIEGELKVNNEIQKRFDEVLSELIITEALSKLRTNASSFTMGFCELKQKLIIQGKYPPKLLELWHKFDQSKGSENDCPDMFGEEQLYLALELEHAGEAVDSFKFQNAKQTFSVLLQTIFTLAVAEESLCFEHRDLHIGNILVKPTNDEFIPFVVNGTSCKLPSYGLKATIIDFTLSRITLKDEVLFYDLSTDPELFTAIGEDYQFEVYRIMKDDVNNNWKEYAPITNLRWLFYLVDKFLTKIKYRTKKTKVHTDHLKILKKLQEFINLPDFSSSLDLMSFLLHSYMDTVNIIESYEC